MAMRLCQSLPALKRNPPGQDPLISEVTLQGKEPWLSHRSGVMGGSPSLRDCFHSNLEQNLLLAGVTDHPSRTGSAQKGGGWFRAETHSEDSDPGSEVVVEELPSPPPSSHV